MQDQVQSEKRDGSGIAPEKVKTEQHLVPTSSQALVEISKQPEKLGAETNKSSCDVGENETSNENVPNMETPTSPEQAPQNQAGSKDDPKLYEEIIKEISALDEMLEQYNDTSLPYITEFETSCGDSLEPTTGELAVTDSLLPVSAVHVVPHQKSGQQTQQQQAHSQSSSSVTNLVAVNDNSSIILPETVHSSSTSSSTTSNASPMNGNNKVVDQNQNLDWSEEGGGRNINGPIIHTSHLIQIPVVEPPPPSSTNNSNGTFKAHSRTFHSVSSSASTSSTTSSSSSAEMNGNSIHNSNSTSNNNERHQHQTKRKGKGGNQSGGGGATTTTTNSSSQAAVPAGGGGGGTYSKGTSYEILIPKITSGSFVSRDSSISSGKGTITTSSHSNRASIMVPVIESQDPSNNTTQSGGKVRPQLNMGIFQPSSSQDERSSSSLSAQGTNVLVHNKDIHATHVPVLETGAETNETHVGGGVIENNGEVIAADKNSHQGKYSKGASSNGNGNGSVSSTYITVSEGKSSLGQSSSGTVSSAVMMMMRGGDEEQWNFPSEKNLPRSLRKTRKTCFLDEGEVDGKLRRAESPYCDQSNGIYTSSDHSVSSSDQCNYVGDVNGRNGSCHKSPRVMPRKGIPSKCEIINKGDGNFALEGPNKQLWNGLQNNQQQQQQLQPHTTIVSTSSLSSSGSKEIGRSDRKKIYEDVVLRSQASSSDQSKNQSGSAQHQQHQQHHSSSVANNSSPSSTFTSSSGVSLSVRSNLTLDEEPLQRVKNANHHHPHHPGKSRKGYHQQPSHNELQQQQPAPKPRVRQQIPSPDTEVPIIPGTNLVTGQNQFIPFSNGRQQQQQQQQQYHHHPQDVYQAQISCTPITMSSHHSPDPVEIGTEEVHRDEPQFTGHNVNLSSSTSSPIKICHPHSLIKSCVDTEFGEIGDNLGIKGGDKVKARRGGRKGELNHSISGFEPVGQEDSNGSLPNQSQMMRMMMMMKSSAKNSVGSASSSSRSSSSSGSVSVKSSSSSSENNCADVFHENIVQDYPTNIFNVAANVADQEPRSGSGSPRGRKVSKDEPSCKKLIDEIGNNAAEKSNNGGNNPVVVMRAKISGSGRGNLQQNANQTGNKKNGNGGSGGGGGSANQGNNSTLEIDDGYLSMINRNEAPLLWPEEFIENETFSRDEMKRLSVHLNDDETDDGGASSNSHSPPHPKTNKGGGEKESPSPNKSEFTNSHQNRNSMSGSSSNTSSGHEHNRRNRRERPHVPGRSSTEKTDYFSDDSLEMEGDEEMILLQSCSDNIKAKGNSASSPTSAVVVRPSTSFIIPFNTKADEQPVECPPRKEGKQGSHPIRKSNSQVSRIPKMVSPASSNNRRSSAGNTGIQKRDSFTKVVPSSHSGGSSPTSGFPKPCSFFIPFSIPDAQANGDGTKMSASTGDNTVVNSANVAAVNGSSLRSTSLPSSRRNSSASTSENKPHHHHAAAIAWNISSSPTGDDHTKLYKPQPVTKASAPDNFLIDSNNKREEGGASNSHPSNKKGEQLKEKVTVVESEGRSSISIEGANKLDFDEINPSNITTTTTSIITQTNSSGGAKPGDSLSKRAKFQKQQTFLVSPSSRESTTCSDGHGQRLIEPDNDYQSKTPSQDTALLLTVNATTTHQNQLREQSNNNNDLTQDTPTTTITTNTEHNQMPFKDNNETDSALLHSQTDQQQQRFEGKMRNVKGEEMRNNVENANDKKKLRTELNPSSHHADDSHNYGATSSESVVLVNGGNLWDFNDTQRGVDKGQKGEGNQNKLVEDQESVAEELESVVKMFLKATADLLHPEDDVEMESGSSPKEKCERDKSISRNLKCEPSRLSQKSLGGGSSSHHDDEEEKQASVVIECSGEDEDDILSELKDYENGPFNQRESNGNVQELLTDMSSLCDVAEKQPLMTSTPLADRSSQSSGGRRKRKELDETSPILRKENSSSAIGGDKRLSFLLLPETTDEEEPVIEDFHEQPPAFIPEPPPAVGDVIAPLRIVAPPHANIVDGSSTSSSTSVHPSHHHNLEGKVALDLLSQRITRKCPSPVENMSVSQFLHNKKNIWAMYDRPYDEDVLPPSFPRGFASRSQENLVDAMTHERLTKSFSARGQSSTLPLNCRPPPVQRRTSTFRNMFNKFRKHKTTDTVIPEGPEIRDEEAQSITSRETGPSEGKKRGFFSRLFRRSRKH